MTATFTSDLRAVFMGAAITAQNSLEKKLSCTANISLFLSRRMTDLIFQSLLSPEQDSFSVSASPPMSISSSPWMSQSGLDVEPTKPRASTIKSYRYGLTRCLKKLVPHFCHLLMRHMQAFSHQIPDVSWIHWRLIIWPQN